MGREGSDSFWVYGDWLLASAWLHFWGALGLQRTFIFRNTLDF